MKNIFKFLLIALFGILLISCEKDEDRAILVNPSASSLTSNKTSVVLDKTTPNAEAITFEWVNPNYGVKVANANELQFAKKGTNFANSKSVVLQDGTKSKTYTHSDFNTIMLDAGMIPGINNEVEVRMVSKLGTYNTVISNIITLNINPYLTAYPNFHIVGDASAVGWNAAGSQILYKADNIAKIYTYLENGKYFRFLGQKDWNPLNYSLDATGINSSYKYFKTWSSNLSPSTPENIQFTGPTGMYRILIDADATQKSINITPSSISTFNPSNLYLVGSINGWNAAGAILMMNLGDGKFEIVTNNLPNDAQFKFIGQQSWGNLEWGNLSVAGNSGFLGPKGDNDNIKFDGNGLNYKISVDIKMGTYKIVVL